LLLNHKQSRKSMLEDMEREYEGYAKGVRGVMTAYKNGEMKGTKIYGPLAQLIHTEKKYITAIETALGSANQNIVTAKEEDAKAAIEYLKKNHLGRATFLPVSAIEPKRFHEDGAKKAKGFVAIAADLVECEKEYQDIVSSFLGNTVVCDTLENAIAMGRKFGHKFRIVTIAGDVMQTGGAMTGGSNQKTTGSLSRTGEIETLGKEIIALEKALKRQEEEKNILASRLQKKQVLLQEKLGEFQEAQKESVRLDAEMQHQNAMLEALNSGFSQLQVERDSIQQRLEDIARDKMEKAEEITRCDGQYSALEEQLKRLETDYATLSDKNKQLLSKLADLNISRNTLLKDIELENDRISRLNTEKSQNAIAMTAKSEEILRIRSEIERMEAEVQTLAEDTQKQESELFQFRDNLEQLAKEKTELDIRLREKQASIKDVQEQVFQLTQQQGKMESRAEKYEMEIEGIVERLLEEYELPYSEAAEVKPGENFDYQEASVKIRSLREQIRALGNINIDAIEEYKNVKERFDFLTTQTNDLEKARRELESVITEMLEIMQSRFAEQFEIINQNFSRVFSSLFGGGRANLTLTDPTHVLESGIEIEAQPPGKKLQSLSLLSGGEKAFTAIALLFAILDVRPTPFCILDEIEAALDDVNVYRFADYLKHYSDKTQFIVVTHRRGTMETANILYGVTMQERGISKLLSLDIDEIQQ
ncbi:MAG: chromosome segregation protein SMC, partial [Clostridia bacterium]|nr:chromosome segregation protein SMC [Clostridia bacterium]